MAEVWPLKLALTESRATAVAEIPVGDWINPQALVAGVVAGDILYGASATALTRLPAGTPGQVLTMGASLPAWSSIHIPQVFRVASAAAMTALPASQGDTAIRTDENKTYVLSSNNPTILSDWWEELSSGGSAVLSVNGNTGVVVITAASIGALTTTTGDARYYTQTASDARYYTQTASDARYYTQTASDARFVKITNTGAASISATGDITLSADSDANAAGAIILQTAGTTKLTLTNAGALVFGSAFSTGATAGQVILPNATSILGADSTNTTNYQIVQVTSGNILQFDSGARGSRFNGPMSFNVAPQAQNAIRITTAFTLTGGTTLIAFNISPTYDVGGTSSMTGFNIKINTAAGTYTTSDIYGVRVSSPALGAGQTVTRLHGILVDDQSGGTTTYALKTGTGMVRFGDRVGLGGDPTTYGILDVQSTLATIIIPRMTTTQKNAMTATNGMIVYDSSIGAVQGYQSGAWTSYGQPGADNASTTGVFFNVDSDNNDGTNADNFIWGRDRTITTGGTELMRLNASGYLLLGTTVTTSVAAFDIVIPRGNFVRGVNNAGTDTKPLIGIDTTDTVLLGSGNVRVQSGIFLVNTAVTTSANSGDIVLANQRGLRILNSGSTTAYLAIERTTVGASQVVRIDPSAVGPVTIGAPGYVDGAAAGDLVLQNGNGLYASNAAGSANVGLIKSTTTNHVHIASVAGASVLIGPTASLATTATDGFLYIDSGAGAPTGVPTAQGSLIPVYYDRTNNFLYAYNGGWKKTTVFA